MTKLIRGELVAIADEYGDDRRSRLVQVEEAKAFSELELTSADPMTVVLSEKGWIRAAKGHDIDPERLTTSPAMRINFPHWGAAIRLRWYLIRPVGPTRCRHINSHRREVRVSP